MLTVLLATLAVGCSGDGVLPEEPAAQERQDDGGDAPPAPSPESTATGDRGEDGEEGGEEDGEEDGPGDEPTPATVTSPRTDPSQFQAGVAVLIYGNEEPDRFRDKTRRALDKLVDLHANSVSVVFPVFQEDWRATEVVADQERTPSGDRLRWFVRAARERDFTVMLRPVLDEASLTDDGQWRGSISPSDRGAWFESYGELVAGYAALAAEEGVEILAIGSELTSLQDDTERWEALAERVRSVYDGQLLYAANWDAPSPQMSGALDWHGVDAFFPLDAAEDAPVEDLATAWDPWLQELEAAGADLDRVVFTEIGVRAQRGGHRRPYVWEHGTPADVEAQERYYEAACETLAPAVGGLYWWRVDFDYPDAADSAESFSPLGKPAEDALRRCYREAARP